MQKSLTLALAMIASTTAAAQTSFDTLASALPPCPTEDSVNCHWDASLEGNREGESFVAILVNGVTVLIYEDGAFEAWRE